MPLLDAFGNPLPPSSPPETAAAPVAEPMAPPQQPEAIAAPPAAAAAAPAPAQPPGDPTMQHFADLFVRAQTAPAEVRKWLTDQWNHGGTRAREALEGAEKGDYAKLNETALGTAMGTIGAPSAVSKGGAGKVFLDIGSPEARPLIEKAKDAEHLHQLVQDAGYHGYFNTHPENPTPGQFIAFEEAKAAQKPAKPPKPTEVDPRLNANGMYSKAEHITEGKMGGSATPQQIMGMLKEVKPEELEHLGMQEFLAGKPKVSKQELLEHIRNHQLELKEVTKQAGVPVTEAERARFDELGSKHHSELTPTEYDEWYQTGERLKNAHGDTKYNQYTTPGGENYRERLHILPAKSNQSFEDYMLQKHGDKFLDMTDDQVKFYAKKYENDQFLEANANAYRSSHWDEPNVLAHDRVSDFTLPNGEKALHAHEIQSDWHQTGREKGYGPEGVPNAPLKKNWHEYVMKRLLRDAAEGGYDHLTFDTGATSAKRYDLSTQLGKVESVRSPDGSHTVIAYDPQMRPFHTLKDASPQEIHELLGKEITDKIVSGGPKTTLEGEGLQMGGEGMKGFYDKILPEFLNKFAKKYGAKVEDIKLPMPSEYSVHPAGDGFRVRENSSGDWHSKPFKTKEEAEKFLDDALGARGLKTETKVHSLKITPEMRNALKKGMPMFAVGGMVTNSSMAGEQQMFAEGGEAMPAPAAAIGAGATPPGAVSGADLVNVVDPDSQQIGAIPTSQLGDALNQGYRVAQPHEVHEHFKQADYGTPGQQAIAGVEGFAQGLAGPLATGAERLIGVDPEGIRNRAEANPGTHMGALIGGLAAPALLTAGTSLLPRGAAAAAGPALAAASKFTQAGALEALGAKGASMLGLPVGEALEGAGAVAKIGSAAVRGAIDNALFQAGDEVSKAILQDPTQSVQTAILSTGLAAVLGGGIGGAIGSVQPLWKATMGGQTGSLLHAIQKRMGGIEGVVETPFDAMIAKTGVSLPPEVRARLASDPEIQQIAKTLEQSDTTKAGLNYQESFKKTQADLSDAIVRTLGKDPENLAVGELSHYEVGKKLAHSLAEEYQAKLDPTVKAFEEYRTRYASTPLEPSIGEKVPHIEAQQARLEQKLNKATAQAQRAMKSGDPHAAIEAAAKIEEIQQQLRMMEMQKISPGTVDKISEAVGHTAAEQGWTASPSSDIMKEIARIQRELPLQKTLKDLQHYISAVGDNMQHDRLGNGALYRAGGILKGILKDAEAGVLERAVGEKEGQAALEALQSARAGYRASSELREAIDSRLHAGGSTSNYAKALREMGQADGEAVLNRLSGRGDADALALLQESFPKSAALVKQFHIDSIAEKAAKQGANGRMGIAQSVKNSIQAMSPELRNFSLSAAQLEKIDAVHGILNEFKNMPHNFSNTARTMDKLFSHLPGTAVGAAAWLTGHNPVVALALGPLMKILSKDAPDAARLALLKFLGSNKPIEPGAFKAMVDFLDKAAKGEDLMTKAAKNVFKADSKVLPEHMMPKEKDRLNLDKHIQKLVSDPQHALSMSSDIAHYLPDHNQAHSEFAMQTAQFLNSLRPDTTPKLPLDSKRPPSAFERAAFDRVLDVAQQPLMVLHYLQKGNITSKDVAILRRLYPAAYDQMAKKLQAEILDKVNKGEQIPYQKRLGLSIFLGTPIDSTMTPLGIKAAQPTPPQTPGAGQPQGNIRKGNAALNKESKNAMTDLQRRENNPPGKQ